MLVDPLIRLLLIETVLSWGTALLFVLAMPWGQQRQRVDALAQAANLPPIGADPPDVPWVVLCVWALVVMWVRALWL